MMSTFQKLIHPIESEVFFKDYYEKRPLVLRREQSDYYDYLLSIDDIDEYMARHDIEYPSLRLVKDGDELDGKDYLNDVPYGTAIFEGLVDNDKMYQHFLNGATVVIQGLDRSNKKLGTFCRTLSTEIPFTFQSNIYLTPSGSKGFLSHYDTHDVFVIQIHGSKKWKIYDAAEELPTKRQRFSSTKTDLTGIAIKDEVELQPGDMLYIPRGFVHNAETNLTHSMHITLGVFPQKWWDFLGYLVTESDRLEVLRTTLPLNLSQARYNKEDIKNSIKDKLNQIVASDNLDPILDKYLTQQTQKRKTSDLNRLDGILNLDRIDAQSTFRRRIDIVHELRKIEDHIELTFYNKTLRIPMLASEVLEAILSKETFQFNDLTDTLDDAGKKTLVGKLVKEGMLTIVSE